MRAPLERTPTRQHHVSPPSPIDLSRLSTRARAGDEPRGEAGPGLAIGHVHLHVGDLERGLTFYRDVLGFELMTFMPGAAAFVSASVSAGGYHHYLGFNVWRGEGVPPVPEGRVGLRHLTVVLEEHDQVAAVRERALAAGIEAEEGDGGGAGGFLVRDPWDIAVRFATHESPSG